VGLDITLGVATTREADEALVRTLLEFGAEGRSGLVVADGPAAATGPLAAPDFRAAVPRGSDRVPVDADGVVRRMAPLLPGSDGTFVPALSLAALGAAKSRTPSGSPPAPASVGAPPSLASPPTPVAADLADYPRWEDGRWAPGGSPSILLRSGDLWRIPFLGPAESVLRIPADAVAALGDAGTEVAEDNPLRGRIVLVGATFADSRDFVQTPVGRLPGVEVHANLVHMLATRRLLRPSGFAVGLAAQLAVVLIAGVVLTLWRPLPGTLLVLALTLAVGLPASYLAYHGAGYTVDVVLPVVATCALGLGAEALRRRRLVDSFGRYVGREVMRAVVADSAALRGDRREVTILVSDLRGFTTLSETMPAERVAAHLNEYFPAMIEAIFRHRGMINDFIGDGILAVFGAPLPDPEHAIRAAGAALAMQEALTRLNQDWAARGLPALRMGIGVHTGTVFAGNVGGPGRIKYTVVGDAVNVTARLESLNKELSTTTLVTEEARRAIGDRAETRYRGEVPVKGRAEPLRVHELLAVHGEGHDAAPGGGAGRGA
jgi:class 3 adenylate cyclase